MIKFELSKNKPIAELYAIGLTVTLKALQERDSSEVETVIAMQTQNQKTTYNVIFGSTFCLSNHYKIWNNFLIDMDIEQEIAKFTIQPASNLIPSSDNILSVEIAKTFPSNSSHESISLATLKTILKTARLTDQPYSCFSGVGPIYKGNIQFDTQSYPISFYLGGHGVLKNDKGKCYEFVFDNKLLEKRGTNSTKE